MPNSTLLGQSQDVFEAQIAANANQSQRIPSNGMRGLAILVPSAWTAANIGFYAVYGDTVVPLRDNEGAKVVISGIATSEAGIYIAPASCWALGALNEFIIASLNTSTGVLINQTALRQLKVIRLR